jgi:hypothetical protein
LADPQQAGPPRRLIAINALYERLPHLRDSEHTITSAPDDEYNCVAWLERDFKHFWAPKHYWPHPLPRPDNDQDLDCFLTLFEQWGYEHCDDPDYESGWLKIAIFAEDRRFYHVAKQLRTGAWSSKVGVGHDLRHVSLDALSDSVFFNYTRASLFMKRADDGSDPMELEERGYLLPRQHQ